jgi:RNA polymerase sigma factor (sigma-70 family)
MGPRLKGQVDPADIVHETLLKAHRAREQFRGEDERQLTAWLESILRNSIKNAIRSLRVTISWGERAPVGVVDRKSTGRSCPVCAAIRNEQLHRISETLAQLPRNQRVVLELRLGHGCSLAEIVSNTGRTRASVVGLLQRGLRTLRALLADTR